ncbi:MAG: hypothetical protein KDI66_11410 [Xanthomonadales bacterium]|nr:hypothetical protein [Xanthomonadales bacterium]
MSVALVLSILLQTICVVHVLRTGRPYWWVWVIIFGSFVGVAVYALTQMLPDLQNDPRARQAAKGIAKTINPERDLRRLREELARADTVQNRMRLGAEFLELDEPAEAEAVFRECLRGMHAEDPDILLALAQAQFAQDKAQDTHDTLNHLIRANPDFKSPEGHLLYARTLQQLGRDQEALAEYEVLSDSYPGEEARVRKAELLRQLGMEGDARTVLETVLSRSKLAPAFYRKAQREWIHRAKQLLKD